MRRLAGVRSSAINAALALISGLPSLALGQKPLALPTPNPSSDSR